MENRINKKCEQYISGFKDDIRTHLNQLQIDNNEELSSLLSYLTDYKKLVFEPEDLHKRKRNKNIVPKYDRCCAKRANSEQCTRRRKDGMDYCGTHIKGTPHGFINDSEKEQEQCTTEKIEVWAQDIKGIVYYVDNKNNVYQTEDIVKNIINPKIIAKYTLIDDVYSIPEFNL